MGDYKVMTCTIVDGVAEVSINRPESYNAINAEVLIETARLCKEIAENKDVKAIVMGNGNEKFFAAGADIRELVDYSPAEADEFITLVHESINTIYNSPVPTIAAISGLCLGGGLEITLVCDFRVAADNAVFALPEINLGVLPGGGGTQMLSKIIGPGKAKELIFFGEMINAQTALNIGLVNKVVPLADLMTEAHKMARKLTRKPPIALKMAKELINNSMATDFSSGIIAEKKSFSKLFDTHDQKEGMKAFMENRRASFTGS
ncbi:MAG: enoyl-CoA hydratase/isomerase family protein [Ignavibacteriales bacterium]